MMTEIEYREACGKRGVQTQTPRLLQIMIKSLAFILMGTGITKGFEVEERVIEFPFPKGLGATV